MLVVVQAGHAGRTTGATGAPGEQAFTVAARNETVRTLVRAGIDAHPIDAGEPHAAYRGDAFFAIHADGSVNPNVRGASIGYQTAEGRRLGTAWKRNYRDLGWGGGWLPDNYTDNLRGYYGVSRAAEQGNRHACIIEAGFITSPADKAIMTPKRVAVAITRAVIDTFGLADYNTGEDDMNKTELLTFLKSGDGRHEVKEIVQGAILDGLRNPVEGDPDKGVFRGQLIAVLGDALDPIRAEIAELRNRMQ